MFVTLHNPFAANREKKAHKINVFFKSLKEMTTISLITPYKAIKFIKAPFLCFLFFLL